MGEIERERYPIGAFARCPVSLNGASRVGLIDAVERAPRAHTNRSASREIPVDPIPMITTE